MKDTEVTCSSISTNRTQMSSHIEQYLLNRWTFHLEAKTNLHINASSFTCISLKQSMQYSTCGVGICNLVIAVSPLTVIHFCWPPKHPAVTSFHNKFLRSYMQLVYQCVYRISVHLTAGQLNIAFQQVLYTKLYSSKRAGNMVESNTP